MVEKTLTPEQLEDLLKTITESDTEKVYDYIYNDIIIMIFEVENLQNESLINETLASIKTCLKGKK